MKSKPLKTAKFEPEKTFGFYSNLQASKVG